MTRLFLSCARTAHTISSVIRLSQIAKIAGSVAGLFLFAQLFVFQASAQVVTPANTQGWSSTTADGGSVSMDPAASAPAGIGALHIVTGPTTASRAEFTRAVNVPLSSVNTLSYYSKQISGSAYAAPSYSIGVLLNGTPSSFTNFVFEPYWSDGLGGPEPILPGVWQQWDVASNTNLWSSRTVNAGGACVTTAGTGGPPFYSLAQLKIDCPSAVVVSNSVYAGSFNPSFNVLADLVNFNGTVFDFEPNSTIVTVSPATPNNWLFYNDETDVPDPTLSVLGSFVNGPATPPHGAGSAQITVSGTQRRNLATYQFSGTPLANITTMRYSTYNPSAGNGQGPNASAYLNFNVDFNGSDTFQRRLVFLPIDNGGVTPNNWKEWDTIQDGAALWRYSGATWPGGGAGDVPKTWSQILAQYPGVRIRVTDAHMGIRVGEPYPPGYTENLDSFTFGTASGITIFDFDPSPIVVDDDGFASATNCDDASTVASMTIQSAINSATPGATIKVCPGNYTEDVNVNKANIQLLGSGIDVSTITGPFNSGTPNTLLVNANGVLVDGFTITRNGNNPTDWGSNLKNQGVSLSAPGSGITLQNCKIFGNRNGIYVGQSSNGNTIRRNIVDNNRTGIHLVDNNGTLIEENVITNNWTMGVLYRSEGGPSPTLQTVRNNRITNNWYSEIEFRDPAGPGLLNMSGNYLGTNVTRVTTPSGEPGYAGQIPTIFGGASVPPASHPTVAGVESARVDYSPYLNTAVDVMPGTNGFQGDFTNLTVTADSPQANGSSGNIQEAINMANAGGSVTAKTGTYAGNVDVNKALTLKGTPTIAGSLTASASGAQISPGFSPGIINSGNLALSSGSTVNIEINGTSAGVSYDQMNVAGTVSLGSAALNVTTGFSPIAGNTFVIVNNDGSDPVSGIFSGLPEGSTFTVSGTTFSISYVGGTGNDVVLTVSLVSCNSVSIPTGITTLRNQQVSVPLNVDDTSGRGIISFDYTVTYNPGVLSYLGVDQVGTIGSGMTITVNSTVPGTLVVSGFTTAPLAGSGALINLRFLATGTIGSSSPVNFGGFMFNAGAPCVSTTNGSVNIISSTVGGRVTYANAPSTTPVPNTTLSGAGSVAVSTSTDACGNYLMSGFGSGAYTVTPSKSGDVNGITTFDAAKIAQHVVGLITLNSNQLLAADVSNDNFVNSFDAALIAQWIVSIPNPGTTGTWKFIPVSRSYPDVETAQTNQDYSAILMGEVTGDWVAPGSCFAALHVRPVPVGDPIQVSVPNISAGTGETINIPVDIQDLSKFGVIAHQFDIRYNPKVLSPDTAAATIAGTLSEGMTVVSNSPEPGLLKVGVFGINSIEGKGTLIDLRFKVIGPEGSNSALQMVGFILNDGSIPTVVNDGSITVTANKGPVIRGKVLTALGMPISNASVTMSTLSGETRTVLTGSFGTFEFGQLSTGESYTLNAHASRYSFNSQTVVAAGSAVSVDMIAKQ